MKRRTLINLGALCAALWFMPDANAQAPRQLCPAPVGFSDPGARVGSLPCALHPGLH